jgi:hypothetical protein
MGTGNPKITTYGVETRFKAKDTDKKLGKRVFSVKLPLEYEEKLLSLPKDEKIALMRSSIMNAIDKLQAQGNEEKK